MKKEVSPWIAIVGILVTLTVVMVVYWQGLLGGDKLAFGPGDNKSGGAAGGGEEVEQTGPAVTTVAGRPQQGYADGPAAEALFNGPSGVAVGRDGSVYVADSRNHCIRKISRGGTVSTLAGRNVKGYADGSSAGARFSAPAAVALAPDGSLLVADTGNHRIRRVAADGRVTTLAGSETPKDDIGRPMGGRRDGAAAEAQFRYPVGLAVDGAGAIYVADAGNHCVRRIASGQVSTLAVSGGEMDSPTELALVGDRLWVADTGAGALWVGPKTGPLARRPAPAEKKGAEAPGALSGLAAIGDDVYAADSGNQCIYEVAPGRLSPVAGSVGAGGYADGRGAGASFSSPAAIAAGPGDSLYVADFGNNCIRQVMLEEGR